MFRWSHIDVSANPDDEAIHPPNTALLFDQEQWEQTVDEEIEVTTENPSRGNIADHPLLDARQEQALATSLRDCFRRLQQQLAGNSERLATLLDQIQAEEWPAQASRQPELKVTLDAIITTHDHWQLCRQCLAEPAREQALLQRLIHLFDHIDINRDFILQQAENVAQGTTEATHSDLVHTLHKLYDVRNQLVECNVRLVYHLAKRHRDKGMEFDDLVQEGILGLLRAAIKFDAQVGVRFSTYAFWWIQQAMRQAIAKQRSLIRYPTHINHQVNRMYAFMQAHRSRAGRNATPADIQRETGFSRKKIQDLRSLSNLCISADTPLFDDGQKTLLDELSYDWQQADPDSATAIAQQQRRIQSYLDRLSDREATIVRLKYGIGRHQPYSLNEIAPQIGVSRERVRQILEEALEKLRLLPG
ncbi:MAG TPA: hypothetical protein DEP79_11575 [Gammaproteobacteria bacterium]|nr:hypothetical protein [Gammaproteobacteria bacterium]